MNIAREQEFLRRKSKIGPCEFLDTLMFSPFNFDQLSLQNTCNDLNQQHNTSCSKVALHKRFNQKSVSFLKAVLAFQLSNHLSFGKYDSDSFNRILVGDSCKFSIPKNLSKNYPGYRGCRPAKALMNLQYCFDLKSGNWQYLELTKATENDQRHIKEAVNYIQKGDLSLRDLGFITQGYLEYIISKEAFFLNRMPPTWTVYDRDDKRDLNWKKLLCKVKKHKLSFVEKQVFVGGKRIPCRLVAYPVPDRVYKERIKKVEKHARSKNVAVSDAYKVRARFNVFITNVAQEVISTADVMDIYRLRWQIELVFKTWKSLTKIHKVKAMKKHRLECQLLAKLIFILLNWKIFQSVNYYIEHENTGRNCSLWKFLKNTMQNTYTLRLVLKKKLSLQKWSRLFLYPVLKSLLIEPKKGEKTHYSFLKASLTS